MTDRSPSRALAWFGFAALAIALACAGYWLLFTTFMVYDDEGYVLVSLKHFSEHGGLYDQVYTQYGPFPYLLYDALHRLLGFAFSNTSGRWITLVNWFGAAAICAALVGQLTRSLRWSAFTLAAVFTHLWVMINEPIHPGGLGAAVTALATWAGAEAWRRRRFGHFAMVAGAASALLALIKINVGVFYFAAAFTWLGLHTEPRIARRTLLWLLALGGTLLPFVLMRTLIGAAWVRMFALVFTGATLGMLLTVQFSAVPSVRTGVWVRFFAAFTGAAGLVCGALLLRGTSWAGMIDGILLEPLKHPGVYHFAMNWRMGTGVLALSALGFAAWIARTRAWAAPSVRGVLACARLTGAVLFLCTTWNLVPTSIAAWVMCYGVTLAWVYAVPLREDRAATDTRLWLALVLVFGSLQAYPVAGSQINWGTFLWLPLLALGLHDASPVLVTSLGRASRLLAPLAALGLIASSAKLTGELAVRGWERYATGEPLGLKGAENLRLPDDITSALRITDENVRAHADTLFSFPGVFSTNLWTERPTPTLANVTHWFTLLSLEQQRAIMARLAGGPRAALIVQRDVIEYLLHYGFSPDSPLYGWLGAHFERKFAIDGYELWLPHGRNIAPLSTGRWDATSRSPDRTLVLTLRAPIRPVASVEICDVLQPDLPAAVAHVGNARAAVASCSLDGSVGPAAPAAFPLTWSGVAEVRLHWHAPAIRIPVGRTLLVLRDSAGNKVATARMIE